ncbi:hypothetical protein E1B22_07935 [Thermaerobacter sp. FW80]|uniref:hypothetical protein n=1 Tax=Thermaerobacter sp. FW80 TaxID=2546351 RepID=UPI001074B68C|nr:hypothetical protein [Thermaerobacter sp. FW80]QBS37722.1 hypothetical protein E1B22_07935 [Thermaerobacter sp. FW80]
MVPWTVVAAVAAAIEAATGEPVRVRWIQPVGPGADGGASLPVGGPTGPVNLAGGAASAGLRAARAGAAVPLAGRHPSPWVLAGRQELLAARAAMGARPWAAAGRLRARGGAFDVDDGRTRG